MSFTGGKLKLKGSSGLSKGQKKKKKKSSELALIDHDDANESSKVTREGYVPEQPDENADLRTAAEKKFEESLAKREQERIAKLASKSHKTRVKEFNEYLANLSEHHDIPRVGPG